MSYLLAKRETNLIEIILLVFAFVLHYYEYYSDIWWLLVERTETSQISSTFLNMFTNPSNIIVCNLNPTSYFQLVQFKFQCFSTVSSASTITYLFSQIQFHTHFHVHSVVCQHSYISIISKFF